MAGYTTNFGPDPYVKAEIIHAEAGVVRYTPYTGKIAIVGAGEGRENAPFNDPDWVVWGINEIAQPRTTAWFELHPVSVQNSIELNVLRSVTVPVYTLELDPAIPTGVRYPLETVLDVFKRRYFTCTFAFQIALALLIGADEIGVWGCGLYMGGPRERLVERPALDYWIGRAEGMGVKVSEDSGLAYQPMLYGYDYHEEVAEIDRQVDGFVHVAQEWKKLHPHAGV